jgi:hemolysin D
MSLARHVNVLKDSWKAETERRRLHSHELVETRFLPAALEVVETPPSPHGRAVMWVIIAAAVTALGWSCLAKVEMVAVAEGRLVPTGRLRSVEALEPGLVRNISVREGQHVAAGQVLIELDPTQAGADARSATTELTTAGLTLARSNALLAYAGGQKSELQAPVDAAPSAVQAERQLVSARISAYEAKRGSIEERRIGAEASARSAAAEIVKQERTLPILKSQLDDQVVLESKGFGARQKVLQLQQQIITVEQDIVSQRARQDEARAQVASLNRDAAELREQFITQAAQERSEAEGLAATRADNFNKADQKLKLQTLSSPVSGTIQSVAVTTLGEVVESGKPIVTLVPDGEALVVEALMLNKDVGFVHVGAPVVVKLEAYPFTRYGTIEGTVTEISPDAIVDEKRGLVFPVRIKLAQSQFKVEGQSRPLFSGMSVSAEIVTGKRRVISYIWSPVSKAVSEAGRER